ncbi:hypothetical protein PBY51_014876 [Eleginops maclovinus]|uniref:Uncharacterized protein n=1 Tax=Eleginops maclovinus TaxID=56733 RepID=A0AAN7X1J7_ELEMC|nr:hypothetical protein PBY51_014876 [Eleginops maclovinus]
MPVLCLTTDNGPPPGPEEADIDVVVSPWHHVRADEDIRSILFVSPYTCPASSSRLGPRHRGQGPVIPHWEPRGWGCPPCVCVVRMEGKGYTLP